jgi:hypothetical protein
MATLAENREDRADAIISYYTNLQEYNTQVVADGDDIDASKPQAKFKAFNDLIKIYHDELKDLTGYASASAENILLENSENLMTEASEDLTTEDQLSYLPSEEGAIDTTDWWYNANVSNLQANMFFTDSTYLFDRSALYIGNGQTSPNARHPYALWNQFNTALGTYNDFAFVNVEPSFVYTDSLNPFATGANYKMKEPLEYYGAGSNLLWGAIVHNGVWAYRSQYIGNVSYTAGVDTGFKNYQTTGVSLGNMTAAQTASNLWPSPFEIMRYTFWGTGTQGSTVSRTIANHSGTSSGSFTIATASQLTPNTWYIFYHSSTTTQGWILKVGTEIDISGIGSGPWYWTYSEAYWPVPTSGNFNGASRQCTPNPVISASEKTTAATSGRKNVWDSVYAQYFTGTSTYPSGKSVTFKTGLAAITDRTNTWITNLDIIINHNYTIIDQEMGVPNFGISIASIMRTDINVWLSYWKTLIGDSGSGPTYTVNDSKWSDANLDDLFTNTNSGLNKMITFTSGSRTYNGTQTGYIATRRNQIYNTIFGKYNLGLSEVWNPDLETFVENNTGFLDTGKLYWYRHNYIDARLNRESGTLTIARDSYYTYLIKLNEIAFLETQMAPLATDFQYDMTPVAFDVTQDEEDVIVIDWDDTKAAASYDIQRKTGISGSWNPIQANYGYVDPGSPPDFTPTLGSSYNDSALTSGYQEFGLSFTSSDDGTGLNEDFTLYDFNLALDGATNLNVEIKGIDAKSFEALRSAIQSKLTTTTVEIISNDIRITSNKKGAGSTVAITAGTNNDILAALSTIPNAAVPGTTQLEQGKAYYYRVRVNNGYGVVLGSDGNNQDKDWNSRSEWQTDEYANARAINGDVGIVVWEAPSGLAASGVDPGITPSDIHCRLEWNSSPNAASYKIYRATSLNGGYAYIATTTNTFYLDTSAIPGFMYYYKIKSIANADYQLYDDAGNFTGPLESLLSDEGVRGKRLWQTITLNASRDNEDKVTLTWNAMTGSNGYLVYTAPILEGQYTALTEDDGKELVILTNTYIDARVAKQFFEKNFASTTDGIASGDYEPNARYYFVVLCTDEISFETTVKQYYITAPASGTWTCQVIANSINTALAAGLNNAICELVLLENPETYYKIRFSTKAVGVDAEITIQAGTFGESLLSLLSLAPAEPGDGAYLALEGFYKVQAVEVVSNEIVRYSELSNIAAGLRPIPLIVS